MINKQLGGNIIKYRIKIIKIINVRRCTMGNENYFLEKLEKMLFLEIKKGSKINEYTFKENIYLPVNSDKIVSKTKEGDDLSDIPVNFL